MEPLDEKTRLFIEQNQHADVAALALKLAGRTDIDSTLALRQIEGRQRLAAKVPSWAAVDRLRFPQRLSPPATKPASQPVSTFRTVPWPT